MRISDWSSDVCSSDLFRPGKFRDAINVAGGHADDPRAQLIEAAIRFGEEVGLYRAAGREGGGEEIEHDRPVPQRLLQGQGEGLAALRRVQREIGRASCRARVCQYV